MTLESGTYWVIRAGELAERDDLFRNGTVAIGWADLGDLSSIGASRPAFLSMVAKQWSDWSKGLVQNSASQLFRFVHEMSEGDAILYPCKPTREIYYGKIIGPYHHVPSGELSNRRKVQWDGKISRDALTQGAKYELGSALTLFQFKNYADDFRSVIGKPAKPTSLIEQIDQPQPEDQDETV